MYQLKLTELQRESLLHGVRLNSKLQGQLQSADAGTQPMQLTKKELEQLAKELETAVEVVTAPHKTRLLAVKNKVAQQLQGNIVQKAGWGRTMPRPTTTTMQSAVPSSADSESIYQFKITLLDIQPLIWRQMQIPDCTLGKLHHYIQVAFGWENCHMHQFSIDGDLYGAAELSDNAFDLEFLDEEQVKISQLIPATKRKIRWMYEYDFGDGWRHEILFEGTFPALPKVKYPLCAAGERACPPEDCGGPWGFADFVTAISNRKHERYAELWEFYGPFDPQAFNAKKATKDLQKIE